MTSMAWTTTMTMKTGSLTRAVEDDLRRQKKMEQSRMAQATAKLEQMERHQHRLRYQGGPIYRDSVGALEDTPYIYIFST